MYWLFCVTVTCESGECKSLRSQYAFSILCLCFFLFILQFTFNYAHLYVRMCVCVITSLVQTLNCSDCHYQRGRTQMYVYMCVDQLGRRQGFPQWRRGGKLFRSTLCMLHQWFVYLCSSCHFFVVTVAIAIGAFAVVLIFVVHYQCSGAAKVLL